MYKQLSDSTLMNMTKKEIIEHLRIAEYNYRICEETIEQQYQNYLKILKNERTYTINECIQAIKEHWIMWNVGIIKAIIDRLEELKEKM